MMLTFFTFLLIFQEPDTLVRNDKILEFHNYQNQEICFSKKFVFPTNQNYEFSNVFEIESNVKNSDLRPVSDELYDFLMSLKIVNKWNEIKHADLGFESYINKRKRDVRILQNGKLEWSNLYSTYIFTVIDSENEYYKNRHLLMINSSEDQCLISAVKLSRYVFTGLSTVKSNTRLLENNTLYHQLIFSDQDDAYESEIKNEIPYSNFFIDHKGEIKFYLKEK